MKIERTVITVVRHEDQWAVEHEGQYFGHSPEKDVAKAAAARYARETQDGGRLCQVRITGETGYFG